MYATQLRSSQQSLGIEFQTSHSSSRWNTATPLRDSVAPETRKRRHPVSRLRSPGSRQGPQREDWRFAQPAHNAPQQRDERLSACHQRRPLLHATHVPSDRNFAASVHDKGHWDCVTLQKGYAREQVETSECPINAQQRAR